MSIFIFNYFSEQLFTQLKNAKYRYGTNYSDKQLQAMKLFGTSEFGAK